MAKKVAKKASKKASKKTAKKASRKAAARKPVAKTAARKAAKKPGKKTSKKGSSLAPKMISTGKGHTPAELGKALVQHCQAMGNDMDLWKKHFHKGFTSIEGTGQAFTGIKAVEAKCKAWMDAHIIHSAKATGPFVGATGFSVLFDMDVEAKDGSMPRMIMQEVGVYTVKNGKVVQEEFMYGGMC